MVIDFQKKYREFFSYISASQKILILGHKSPDGDSVGSALAMQHILQGNGKEVCIAMSGDIPSNLHWLSHKNTIYLIEKDRENIEYFLNQTDLILCVDFNILYRVGKDLEDLISSYSKKKKVPLLMIDHHLDPDDSFDWKCSCTEASATAEVIGNLFFATQEGEGQINEVVATCLMTGVLTDTGLFNHNSSSPELYDLVARLLRKKADKDYIVNQIFHSHKESRQRLEGYILYEKVQILSELNCAYFTLTLQEQRAFGISSGDTDGLVNKPLDIEGINCVAFFRETIDEGIKISVRSIGDVPVNELCKNCYGGGGHKNASGAEMRNSSMEEVVKLFVDYVKENFMN